MIDSHAHLNNEQFDDDFDDVLERAWTAGLTGIINIGFDLPSSKTVLAMAEREDRLYAVVGVHPHDADTLSSDALEELRNLAGHPKVCAIGETGLDYYYQYSSKEVQKQVFQTHLDLARELEKPAVIHSRDAAADTMEIIAANDDVPCVLHCYSGSLEMAKRYLEMGHYISFGGPVTFKNASRLRQVASGVPLGRMLIETDCPFLAPVPYRGKRNEPAYVGQVAEKVAELHNVSSEEVREITADNTKRIFDLVSG